MTGADEIAQLSGFLSRYAAYEKKITTDRVAAEIGDINSLFEKFAIADVRFSQIRTETAPYYNIFGILNVRHYETKLHTPFLRHLLTPSASHEQGSLFFDSFLQRFVAGHTDMSAISSIYVYEELSTSYGRLDLLLEYRHCKEQRAIVIENKIYAPDQDKQLERYYQYLISKGYKKGCYHIIYLKPNRDMPTVDSISPELLKQLKIDSAYTSLGYHEDIAPWLQSLVLGIIPPQVQHTITQYINTIKTL